MKNVWMKLLIIFMILMTSCNQQDPAKKRIFRYLKEANIPQDDVLVVVNGLGCEYCRSKTIKHFHDNYNNKDGVHLITGALYHFNFMEIRLLDAIDNKFIDSTNIIQRLDFTISGNGLVKIVSQDSLKEVSIYRNNVDSVLNLIPIF